MQFSWQNLPRPFYVLAPMEGATDAPFRQVIARCGRPHVMFTEFVNVEGLISPKGSKILERMLDYEPDEQPLIAQIWGLNPKNFYTVAKDLVKRGFAGVDVNMGCPDRAVIGRGTGSALINNPNLASEIITAVKEGVAGRVPVSVKTRIGFKEVVTEQWAEFLLSQNIDALTIHGRTTKEMSLVPVHWDEIAKVVKIRDGMKLRTVIIGNGDVLSLEEADQKALEFGLEGIMIGRGVFHNPWLFNKQAMRPESRSKQERVDLLLWHIKNYERLLGPEGRFDPLKRFFKIYIQNFEGASEMRETLMQCRSYQDVYRLLQVQ